MFASLKRFSLLLALVMALPMASQATGTVASCPTPAPIVCPNPNLPPPVTQVDKIWSELMFGNALFSVGLPPGPGQVSPKLRAYLAQCGQAPKGIILSCIDSRVPPEEVFRQGLGDFFVSRIAGNVPLMGEIASVEYAVEHVGVPLILVVGHTKCGAVNAAVGAFEDPTAKHTPALTVLVDDILPAVEETAIACTTPMPAGHKCNAEGKMGDNNAAYHLNATLAAENLLLRSKAVCEKVEAGAAILRVAIYDITTGKVTQEGGDILPTQPCMDRPIPPAEPVPPAP